VGNCYVLAFKLASKRTNSQLIAMAACDYFVVKQS